jgi:hypothetical protein
MAELLPLAAAGVVVLLVHVAVPPYLYLLVHVAVPASLYRAAASTDPDPAGENVLESDGDERQVADRPAGGSDDPVPCPSCGVPNDPGYRICRRCVADLQRSVTPATTTDARDRLGS